MSDKVKGFLILFSFSCLVFGIGICGWLAARDQDRIDALPKGPRIVGQTHCVSEGHGIRFGKDITFTKEIGVAVNTFYSDGTCVITNGYQVILKRICRGK